MPFGAEGVEPGIGLALSGGGFRATLFHCGALWRLGELGILARLDRVSSVSGGSITAGALATRWKALRFEGDVAVNLREEVIAPLQAFCHRTIDAPAIGLAFLSPWISMAIYAGVAIMWFVPDRRMERVLSET